MKENGTDNNDQKTAEALTVLAGQVATIAGQAIGLQIAVGAIIENAPNREALCASIWSAWERVQAGSNASPASDSKELLLKSVAALLQQIGAKPPPAG